MSLDYLNPYNDEELKATNIEGVFEDPRYKTQFIVGASGKLVEISSPSSGGAMVRADDGSYMDPYIGGKYSFDANKEAFIPLFLPDESMEPARIEGNQLIGINSGTTYEIDANGKVLTPEELSFQRSKAMDEIKLAQIIDDGGIDEYFRVCQEKQRTARDKIEQARREGNLDSYFKNLLEAEDVDHILLHFDEIVVDIPSQSKETIEELLQYFNAKDVTKDGVNFRAYNDPVITFKLNDRYRELTGLDHPTVVQEFPNVINKYRRQKDSLVQIGGYFNDSYFQQLDEIYTDLMTLPEEGIEPTDLSKSMMAYEELTYIDKLRRDYASMGLEMPEDFFEMAALKKRVEDNEVTVDDVHKLCDTAFGKDTSISKAMADAFILSGRVKSTDAEYARTLKRNVERTFGKDNPRGVQVFNAVFDIRNTALRVQKYNEQMAKHGAPTEEMIADATRLELIDMRTQIYQNNPDLAYREEMREHYLSTREDGSYVVSKFDVIDGEQPVCQHSLELVSEQGKTVLQSRVFDYTEDFQHSILEPALTDYAECSPDMRATISSHLVDGIEWASADYRVVSGNNNVVSVNNIPTDYAQEIANKVQQVEPVQFEAQHPKLEQKMQMGGHQYVLTKTGFTNPLLLTLLLGFVLGLGIVLGFYLG